MLISIKQHTKEKAVIEYIEKQISDPEVTEIQLVGEVLAVNKTITIAEIIKRKYANILSNTTLEESPEHPNEPKITITLTKSQ